MVITSLSVSLSPHPLSSSLLSPKPRFSINSRNYSSLSIASSTLSSKRAIQFHDPLLETQIWKFTAVSGDALTLEANSVETSEQIVASGGDDGVSNIVVSVLLFLAFIALSLLTIGVIYIAGTDFLQKRESDKFAKEEEARIKKKLAKEEEARNKKKKKSKNKKARARAGPRGFGKKRYEEEDD